MTKHTYCMSIIQSSYSCHCIEATLKMLNLIVAKQNNSQDSGNAWLNYIISSLEAFLDAGDAVKRRKQAMPPDSDNLPATGDEFAAFPPQSSVIFPDTSLIKRIKRRVQ